MSDVVWLGANTLTYPRGGGHFRAYLNWALGLKEAGCEVVWLEHFDPSIDEAELDQLVTSLRDKLSRYGLADKLALCSRDPHPRSSIPSSGLVALEAAGDAALFLNLSYGCWGSFTQKFRRSALLDIDPGLLQLWLSQGIVKIAPHDFYFTIGENVGNPQSLFPDAGLDWIYTLPCVALQHWPQLPESRDGAFSTITHWSAAEWFIFDGKTFPNDKRTGFLPYLDLPRLTSQPLELALCLAADDALCLTNYEAEERARLEERGWQVVHSHAVSATPWEYQSYIQRSRGEFSCAKPIASYLQTGWISDRTICYLASGRPAIVQYTGRSCFLPDARGLFRFRNLQEAADAIETVANNYSYHSAEARRLAEDYFAADKVFPQLLDRALDKNTTEYFSPTKVSPFAQPACPADPGQGSLVLHE